MFTGFGVTGNRRDPRSGGGRCMTFGKELSTAVVEIPDVIGRKPSQMKNIRPDSTSMGSSLHPMTSHSAVRGPFTRPSLQASFWALTLAAIAVGTVCAGQPARTTGPAFPNIVLILADDLGYGDLGCYNSQSRVPTPHLDQLAREGMRFTDAYTPDAVCTPSRYALMTGRYYLRASKKSGVLGNWDGPAIEKERLTLPALFKKAGYTTGGFGKWHLGATYATNDGRPPRGKGLFKSENTGANLDLAKPIADGPTQRGFDRWFGFICASESLVFDQDRPALCLQTAYEPPAAAGVEQLRSVPLADYLPLMTERTTQFIRDQANASRMGKPFFAYYAPYVPHIPLAVSDGFRGKTRAGDYGDYVHQLDHSVGQLLAELRRQNLADSTLVIFASDNGSQFPQTGDGHRPNAPFKGTKWLADEGGVRTPLIATWPGRIAPGSTTGHLAALPDLLATCAELTRQELPPNAGEDSFSLLPVMLGKNPRVPARGPVVSRASAGRLAIRVDRWKYLAPHRKSPAELYDLRADPGETNNLADREPEQASRLRSQLDALLGGQATRPGAVPNDRR